MCVCEAVSVKKLNNSEAPGYTRGVYVLYFFQVAYYDLYSITLDVLKV